MTKVASTDQLGRLILLAAEAIERTREGQRTPEQTETLLNALQTYKDPNRTKIQPTTGCCGYPHHSDDPKRPDFGPNQIQCLEQIKPGMHIVDNPAGRPLRVTSYPFRENGKWIIKVMKLDGSPYYLPAISLADRNVVQYSDGRWNDTNWISFFGSNLEMRRHHCYRCH